MDLFSKLPFESTNDADIRAKYKEIFEGPIADTFCKGYSEYFSSIRTFMKVSPVFELIFYDEYGNSYRTTEELKTALTEMKNAQEFNEYDDEDDYGYDDDENEFSNVALRLGGDIVVSLFEDDNTYDSFAELFPDDDMAEKAESDILQVLYAILHIKDSSDIMRKYVIDNIYSNSDTTAFNIDKLVHNVEIGMKQEMYHARKAIREIFIPYAYTIIAYAAEARSKALIYGQVMDTVTKETLAGNFNNLLEDMQKPNFNITVPNPPFGYTIHFPHGLTLNKEGNDNGN